MLIKSKKLDVSSIGILKLFQGLSRECSMKFLIKFMKYQCPFESFAII